MGKTIGNTKFQRLPVVFYSRSCESGELHFTSHQNRGKVTCRFPPISSPIFPSHCA